MKIDLFTCLLFGVTSLVSCAGSRTDLHPIKDKSERTSFIEQLQDPAFLKAPPVFFSNSEFQITLTIANPFTCISKVFYIGRNETKHWNATSYRYRICDDTAHIERVNIKLGAAWDSVFSIIERGNLRNLEDQEEIINRIYKQKTSSAFVSLSENGIHYTFSFREGNHLQKIGMHDTEAFRDAYAKKGFDVSGFNRLLHLRTLFSQVFDLDTEFRYK